MAPTYKRDAPYTYTLDVGCGVEPKVEEPAGSDRTTWLSNGTTADNLQ